MFFVSGAEEEHKTQERNASKRHRLAAAMMQGADYDDVAKVGAADRGDFRSGDRAHKDKAQLGPHFQL